MCLLAVAWGVVPGTPLLIGANRDEILNRSSTACTVLQATSPRILGGRDEVAGGTWLAVNEHGVFAGLTNQPLGEAKDPSRRSRGELPLALAHHQGAPEAVDAFLDHHRATDYNGSWLFVGDRHALFFIDFTGLAPAEPVLLPPGIHVLENRPLGEPSPKVARVSAALRSAITGTRVSRDSLQRTLADHTVPAGAESLAAANCVHLEEYGTRSSCIVQVSEDEDAPPQIWVADGPPCVAPFADCTGLWAAPPPVRVGL